MSTQYSCSKCQSCNTCQACNASCNASSGCNSKQTFCPSAQRYGDFSFSKCVSKNELICKTTETSHFSRTTWNEIVTHINGAFSKGAAQPSNKAGSGSGVSGSGRGGSSGISADSTNLYITAEQFKKAATALGSLGGTRSTSSSPADSLSTLQSVVKDNVIYGHYFESLEYYADNLLLKTTQCNDCNAGCNVTCNACQKCNQGCQANCDQNSQSYCCGCDSSCESCETSCQKNNDTGGTT